MFTIGNAFGAMRGVVRDAGRVTAALDAQRVLGARGSVMTATTAAVEPQLG